MNSHRNRTIVLVGLLVAMPIVVWLHTQSRSQPTGHVTGTIVDLRTTVEQIDASDDGRPPGESIQVWAVAEYRVAGQIHRRALPAQRVAGMDANQRDPLETFLIGSRVTIAYDPKRPGHPPPLDWRLWLKWSLSGVCVFGLAIVIWQTVERHWRTLDRNVHLSRTRNVLTAQEFRLRNSKR